MWRNRKAPSVLMTQPLKLEAPNVTLLPYSIAFVPHELDIAVRRSIKSVCTAPIHSSHPHLNYLWFIVIFISC